MVVKREKYFSEKYSEEFNVPYEKLLLFFENEFQQCLVGKADLKEALKSYLDDWKWEGTVDTLLDYWFRYESTIDQDMLKNVAHLRQRGIKCYFHTNNEKYRTDYILEKLGLSEHCDKMFSSAYLGHKKPESEFWQKIFENLNEIEKVEVLAWDDDKENVQSAKQFGFMAEFYADFNSYETRMKELLS